jgi:predicted NBD/HSP70 family sugar kinase
VSQDHEVRATDGVCEHCRVVVVDIGGSGVRLATAQGGTLGAIDRASVDSLDEFTRIVTAHADGRFDALAVAAPGTVDPWRGVVASSTVAPWLEGNLADDLGRRLSVPVRVLNDGEAHGLAMLADDRVTFGAICLPLGTNVGMGVIDIGRHVVRPLTGGSWGVSMWRRDASTRRAFWWELSAQYLLEQDRKSGERKATEQFGRRLASLLAQLAIVFQPGTVALAGGIAHGRWETMRPVVESEIRTLLRGEGRPDIIVLRERESALAGLAQLPGSRWIETSAPGVWLAPAPRVEQPALGIGQRIVRRVRRALPRLG